MTPRPVWLTVLLVLVVSLAGCKLIPGKKPPQAPPGAAPAGAPPAPAPAPPVPLSVLVRTSETVNPGENSRPSPVVVRLYQLKNDVAFRAASYDRLYEDDKGALGSDLIERSSVTLRPSDQTVLSLLVGSEVRFIGVAAFYRQYDNTQWKIVIATPVKGDGTVLVDKSAVSFTSK